MSERRLISIRRNVPAEREAAYAAAWERVAAAAAEIGAHAWRFRSLDLPESKLEFLEWKGGDPRSHTPVVDALAELDAITPAQIAEAWAGG